MGPGTFGRCEYTIHTLGGIGTPPPLQILTSYNITQKVTALILAV